MHDMKRFLRAAALAAPLFFAAVSCAPGPAPSFTGVWSYWSNGMAGKNRYLVVARRGEGFLVQFIDAESGELEGSGSGKPEGGALLAGLGGGTEVELRIAGRNELRATMRKSSQAEDLSFVYERIAAPEGGEALKGFPPSEEPRGVSLQRPNEFGGTSIRAPTPRSPSTRWILLEMDSSWRIRRREIGYPENFLKEDPRISGSFDYGEGGRVGRAEYRFSAAFTKWNEGLRSVVYLLGEDGSVKSRQWIYEAPDGGSPRIVSDDGTAEVVRDLSGNGVGLPVQN
jgi:hypothetical protein